MDITEIRSRIHPQADGCWAWRGAHSGEGYGQVRFEGRNQPTHRIVYAMYRGEIPDGAQIDHLCRNRACCNPDHLEPVTQRVNLLRGESPPARNARKSTCPEMHEYTPENTYVYPNGTRKCRTCRDAQRKAYKQRTGK